MSPKNPSPDLFTSKLAKNPAIRPSTIHAMTPMTKLRLRGPQWHGFDRPRLWLPIAHAIRDMAGKAKSRPRWGMAQEMVAKSGNQL
jgi:hypothetical protein